ncbi:MAG: hypothetical protein CXX81_28195 [Methanobacteriota archaeon]|nr:MAG: hypothetical protein CXX81_28195 [Euryarchaeota archaeon]
MSGSSVRAMTLTLLMVTSFFAVFPIATEATVISADTHWSGSVTIDDNVLVTASRTLTIEAGTQITVTGDYLITVDGTVDILGTETNPVSITNNNNPGGFNSNTGWWDGFLVSSSGDIDASWVTVSRGRTIFDVAGSATFDNTTVEYSFIGADVSGSASITGLSCANVDFTCLSVLQGGSASAESISVSASGNGVENGGSLSLDGLEVSQSGIGLLIFDGSNGGASNLDIDNVSIAVLSRGVSSFTVDSMRVDDSSLLLDAINSDGLEIDDVVGENLDRLVVGSSMGDISFENFVINGSGANGWLVAADSAGSFTLSNSTLNGFDSGLRFTGSGLQVIEDSSISTSGSVFDISGTGSFEAKSSTFTSTSNLGYFSGVDSSWDDSILTTDSTSNGLELISGKHTFDTTSISRDYLYSDTSSFGLAITWAVVDADELTLSGWSDGAQCRTDCELGGVSLTVTMGGVQSGSGINIDGGSVTLDSLSTGSSLHGVHVLDGDLHVSDWTGTGHGDSTLLVNIDQMAIVRNLPAYSSNGLWDAEGDGMLLFGGSNARVNMAQADEFTESTISVTDLSDIAIVGVNVEAHGFFEVTDSNGEADLPLLISGSDVSADDGVYGVTDVISPPGGNLQLPVIPTTGAWVIPIGVHAVLIGNNYTAPSGGDVTISTSASLTLKNAHLAVPNGDIVVEGSGQLIGENGSTDAVVRTTGGHAIEGIGAGLLVLNDVHHGCSFTEHVWSGLHVEGDFYLEQTCRLNIYDGSVLGTIHPSMGGYFSLSNAAQIRVVDFGEPVEGATVAVQGNQLNTNQDGIVLFSATYRNVTEVSDSSTGLLQVYVQRNGHSQTRSWDPTSPTSLDVMMSTVNGGYLAEWLRLDAAFTPYYLDDNLTITTGTTLTILPYSSLSVKADRGISVSGVLEATQASIIGSDWNGVSLLEGGEAVMSDSHIMGGSLTIGPSSSSTNLEGMILSNTPIFVSGSGVISLSDSLLHQADNCIFSNGGQITVSGTTIQDCSQSAAMLTQSLIDFSNITLGSGNEKGLHLRGSSGSVVDVVGNDHDGSGPALHLEMVDSSLLVSGVNLSGHTLTPAISVEWSDLFTLTDSDIQGSPGMIIDHSTVEISNVNFHGDGDGVAMEITGARADASLISECSFDNYETSVLLNGQEGDLEMPMTTFSGNTHDSITAYVANGLAFISQSETIQGGIETSGSKEFISQIWDPVSMDSSDVFVSEVAAVVVGSTWQLAVTDDAGTILTEASIEVTVSSFDGAVEDQTINADTSSGSAMIPIIYQSWTESGTSTAGVAVWRANAPSYVEGEGSFVPGEFSERNIVVQLTKNLEPQVSITLPFPDQDIQEGTVVNFSASGYDSDSAPGEVLSYTWYLRAQGENAPGTQIFTGSSGTVTSLGEVGVYIVTVKVTDGWGGIGEDAITITVVLDDADSDFIDTCLIDGPNAWYDLIEDRPCGPDIYDDDDDNDGISDGRDVFPTDPCAHSDHDMDGMPNSLLPNCETDLIEDDDDDNDGTLDSADADPLNPSITGADGTSESSGLLSPSVILPIFILIIVVVVIFLRGSRSEFGGQEDA